ncbi:MAG: hypothetical protein ACYTBZ_06040 [Planctomycetota bacterium]|jgi:hypothetical protein
MNIIQASNCMRNLYLFILFTLIVSLFSLVPLFAQTTPTGIIHDDVVWSGQITIASDVTILDATVRVEPGSTIRFISAGRANFGPVLRLNSPLSLAGRDYACAQLILVGTAQRPIIVETPESQPPGAILAGSGSCGSIMARHVIFRRLGTPVSDRLSKPALLLQLALPENDLWLSNCRFEQCGPVRAEFFGSSPGAQINRCIFDHTQGDIALDLAGIGSAVKLVTENIADAGFRIECPQTLITGNVLIGKSASIAIPVQNARAINIDANYVRCTTRRDEGRYALKCEPDDTLVTNNVLIGGTYVIESAPRLVKGNVLIGVAGLEAAFNVPGLNIEQLNSATMTHYLITNLAPKAVVADNLLLGPAYATLATGRRTHAPRIEGNIFDGWKQARRAVHFNLLARKPVAAELAKNIVMRYTRPPIFDEAKLSGTLARVEGNYFANVPARLYENILNLTDLGPNDQKFDIVGQLRFPSQVRDSWLAAYRLRADSPVKQK